MEKRSFKQNPKVFEALHQQGKLTSDGKDWITSALDPFHDWNQPIAGYPDADGSSTVVQCFQYITDVSSSGGVAWDCHISNNAYVTPDQSKPYASSGGNFIMIPDATSALSYAKDMLNIVSVNAGQSTAPTAAASWQPTGYVYKSLGNNIATQSSRVIGMGFEVINTTAELYKQGACTCYRMPNAGTLGSQIYTDSLTTVAASMPTWTVRENPSNVDQANMLKGTTQWTAAEGCYVVCTQTTADNPITGASNIPVIRSQDGYNTTASYCYSTPVGHMTVANPSVGYVTNAAKATPFNVSGAIFTGLSPTTTLRVRLRVYLERAPTGAATDANLAVLASPSAGYDSAALVLYSEIVSRMPVACPVDMNAFADWWNIVSDIAKKVSIPVGTALAGPGGAAAGVAFNAAMSAIDSLVGKNKARKIMPPRPQPPRVTSAPVQAPPNRGGAKQWRKK